MINRCIGTHKYGTRLDIYYINVRATQAHLAAFDNRDNYNNWLIQNCDKTDNGFDEYKLKTTGQELDIVKISIDKILYLQISRELGFSSSDYETFKEKLEKNKDEVYKIVSKASEVITWGR